MQEDQHLESTKKEAPGKESPDQEAPFKGARLTREEIQAMSYWELWGVRRKAGPWFYTLTNGLYAFIAYLFLKVCYLFYLRDFSAFRIDWWSVPLCAAIGLVYWFAHEFLYRKHTSASDSQK